MMAAIVSPRSLIARSWEAAATSAVDYVAAGITYTVQYDNDIADPWSEGDIVVVSVQNDTPGPGIQTVTVRLASPSAGDRRFIRLRLTEE